MWYDFLTNPVFVSVAILLVLAILRLNIVFSIIIAAFAGGLMSGIGDVKTLAAFSNGLGNGAKIAFNYAMLGAFSIVISRSGLTELLAQTLLKKLNKEVTSNRIMHFKYALLFILALISMSSQNLIPIHIAFIPILIPSLLQIFAKFKLDRRGVIQWQILAGRHRNEQVAFVVDGKLLARFIPEISEEENDVWVFLRVGIDHFHAKNIVKYAKKNYVFYNPDSSNFFKIF